MRSKLLMTVICLVLVGALGASGPAASYDPDELNAKVAATLEEFDGKYKNSDEVLSAAKGLLVCPKIRNIGLGVGVERGACALQIDGDIVEYYQAASASFGLTAGVQSFSQLMAFNDEKSLDGFRNRRAQWEIGVDGAATVATTGAAGTINTSNLLQPIVVYNFGQAGLMGDLSVEGSRYKKIGTAADVEKHGIPIHRFVVTADISDLQGSLSQTAQMTIDIDDWVTEADRAALANILMTEGPVEVHNTLAEYGLAGEVKQPGQNTVMQYAYAVDMGEDAEYRYRVVMGSTEPMGFASAKQVAKKVEDNFTIVQLDLNENNIGKGVIVMGPELGWDDDGNRVTIDQRTLSPIKLTSVSYKKID